MNKHRVVITLVALSTALSGLVGCASMDASNQESLLSAAGFHTRTPETPKQKELYAAAPSYKVQRVTFNGKTFYAYKDEGKGVAYVGGEPEYQNYQRLAIEQHIASDNYQAAEMNRQMASNWYGAYGAYAPGGIRARAWR